MIYIRSAIYQVGFALAILFGGLISILLAPLVPYPRRYGLVTAANYFVLWWAKVTCGVRMEIEGAEHLKKDKPFVLVANHQSDWETFVLQIMVKPVCTILKKELLSIPVFGWGLALIKPIAIDRSKPSAALKQILKQGKSRLADGIPVLIFPQGTRVPVGEMGRFNKGAAMLACSAKVPIVTFSHNGGEYWPSKSWLRKPGVIRVKIRPAIDTVGRSVDEVQADVISQLQADMVLNSSQ